MSGLGTNPIVCSNGSLMTNYARIGHAAQQVFPDILQDIIAITKPKHCLYADVTSNRFLHRNLRADEWSMINNVRTNGYVNFDIPLVYKLVRNLNLVPSPSKGWDFHIPPAATEILPGDDIERIRRIRNEILHRGNAQVSDTSLTDYFSTFKDIAIRLETYIGKPKGEFVQKFQILEKCCMDEETEKTYLERLTILRERDINLSKAVENIQKDIDSLLCKESHQIVIEEWEEQNKLFIKTDAVDFILKSLTDNNCCTVIGTSGIGKSATIHHVALFLRDTEGYRIIPIHSPSEIDKYFQRNRKQIFVIDDICGKYTVIQMEVEKWIKRNDSTNCVLKHNSTKVIASCRIQVFNENQFKRLKLFTENFCNLSSKTFYLSSQVKLQIARQYLPELAVEHIKNDLDNYEFLPLMFALYKSLSKENENIDVVNFFRNPFDIYTEEIDALHLLLDKTKFCALFFLVISNGSLNVSLLTNCESEQERQKREDFFENCGIPRNTLRQRILEQLESLVPLFVRSNYDRSRQVISFSAIHDKTFDFLSFYFGHKFQKSFLRFADSEMLYERTMLKSLISPDKTVEDFTIWIADFNEDEFFKRIIDQWSMGDLVSLFCSRQMSLEKCRSKLIDYLNRLPADRRRELITLSIEKKESFVEFDYWSDGCSGLLSLSPLSLAFKRNFSDLIRYILNSIKNTKGEGFSILLIKACSAGLTDVVKTFIDKGSDIHVTDMDGLTPLIASCINNNSDIVRLLIEKGADVNLSDISGETPLILSCKNGNSDVVRLLIEKGADVNLSDRDGHTPLILSCENNNSDIVRLLTEKGAELLEIDEYDRTTRLWSYHNDNSDIVRLLIEKGADVNVSGELGQIPLLWSCKNENSDIVRLLIEKGSDVNVSDMDGDTFLILSYNNNNSDIVRLLIEKGADVNLSDMDGETPLLLSSKMNSRDIVRLLIAKEADFDVSDKNRKNPRISACYNDNSDIVRLLIEKGADINVSDGDGKTPLIWACRYDNSDIVRLLIEKGAEVNVPIESGETPLIWSCKHNNSALVRLIIEKGGNINVSDINRITPLLVACNKDNSDIVRLFIEKGADINVYDGDGKTPLIWSCKHDNSDFVRLLLEKGAKINVSDFDGMTALLYASKSRFSDIVEELILNGADVLLADKNGKTPLMYANENKDRKIENFLSKHLYKLHIFDRKRKISKNETDIEVNYEREAKFLKFEKDKD
ncbi:uncharacterized protein LOC127721476 isoform X2 [Mytilus californianus]|uniref:uncharacterized protein LOC127721476 isoform X2 n=1 Tax=Mytilus californianus TaxID=6549 RepID=UPI002246AD60|nr:uncharacterized protein LOC127721476 isoform X2 [Mytilus californianus]